MLDLSSPRSEGIFFIFVDGEIPISAYCFTGHEFLNSFFIFVFIVDLSRVISPNETVIER